MRFGRTDARHNALAHTGQNGVLASTTYQLVYIGTHRNAGFGYELNTIFGHSCHGGCVYYFRIDTRLHSLEHIAAGQVDGGSFFKREVDVGLRCRHQRMHHALHVSARHVVGFKVVARHGAQPGLVCLDKARHDDAGRHITNAHQE